MTEEDRKSIQYQKMLVRQRHYYDRNRDRILARNLAYYYRKKEERGCEPKKRGRKPKPRDMGSCTDARDLTGAIVQ
jgi:hypothetical protein